MRHHHCGGLPPQGGWHPVSSPQHLGSGDLALDGVPLRPPGSAVPPGLQQRPRGRLVSPSPAPPFRVVAQPDRISFFEKSLVGPNRFICQLRRSSLFDLLLTHSGIRCQQARTRFSCPGTVFRLTRSLRWPSFRMFSRSSWPPRRRSSP